MKGRIGQNLKTILDDKSGRSQLGDVLSRRKGGEVRVAGKVFNVRVERLGRDQAKTSHGKLKGV